MSFSHDFGVFGIQFWPASLSSRMRKQSPDHSPPTALTRDLAICSFSSYNKPLVVSGDVYDTFIPDCLAFLTAVIYMVCDSKMITKASCLDR